MPMSIPSNGAPPTAPRAYAAAGYVGLAGCFFSIVGDIVTVSLRGDISLISHSISRAAAGPHSIVTDIGLSLFALGVAAVAWALFEWKLRGRAYRIGTMLLMLCAAAILLLAAWNGYNRKSAADFGFHMNLVYVLAGLFPLAAALVASGLGAVHRNWKRFSYAVAALWVLSGPIYFLVADDLKGLFERSTLMLLVTWVAAVSVLLIRRSHKTPRPPGVGH